MDVLSSALLESDAPTAEQAVGAILVKSAREFKEAGIYILSAHGSEGAEFVSYSELLGEAQAILGGLHARIESCGRKIALLLERADDFIPAFWACMLGGYVPCPMVCIRSDPDRWEKHVDHVNRLLDHPLFISNAECLRELPDYAESVELDELRRGAPVDFLSPAKHSDPAILMLTSGSTGQAKAVELTHGNILSSMAARAKRQQLTHLDMTFNWIAFDHVAALLESHMVALYVGARQVQAEPAAILADPLQFLRVIDRHRVSVGFAPNFLLGQIISELQGLMHTHSERNKLALDLTCLRRIVTGGEANVVETGMRFLELLSPYGLARDALWPAFGMTETCAASVYSHEFPDLDLGREFAAVGVPVSGLRIRIVDESGRGCSEGQSGELQVSGPMVFKRYYNNEDATRSAFSGDGWFRTGDVGRIEDGRLRLIARNKDSIIVSGVNYYSQELETKLEQLDGIEKAHVAAFPTRLPGADTEALVVAFAPTLDADDTDGLYQLINAVRNTTIMLWGFRPAVILPLPKGAFPKTSLGKIQRSLMRKRLEGGGYEEDLKCVRDLITRQVGPRIPPVGDLEVAITKVFSEILRVEPAAISATMSYFELGGTSLDILRLARALQRFGLDATIPVVLQNPTVRQLAQRISRGDQARVSYEPIVPLQVTGRKTPLFCVHPGNGEVFVLVNLAKYFANDRPFYALRARGFNDGELPFSSVKDMVNVYVDAILRCQPSGPYAIAGYSLGGQIAFEIARELGERGHEVGFLGCIDGRPLHERTSLTFNMATGLALVIDLITRAQFEKLNQDLRAEPPSDEVCARVLSSASRERLRELDLDLQKFAVWARVAHAVETMLFAHTKSGVVQNMTVFCSEGMLSRYTGVETTRERWRLELEQWSKFVRHPEFVDVPGHHHILMGPKHVAAFQAILRRQLDTALEDARHVERREPSSTSETRNG